MVNDVVQWQDYFQAAQNGNLLAAFDALVTLGMRPLPIRDDHTGAIKIPIGENWGNTEIEKRRELLARHIEGQTAIGIGVQADEHLVIDIDPPGKDRGRLSDAWKEASTILLGQEDWPDTLTIKTVGGCHVWFKISEALKAKWTDKGKLKMPLPCGGACEFFTGNAKQIQVAVPPSEGKSIARAIIPADLPQSIEKILLDLLEPKQAQPVPKKVYAEKTSAGEKWFMDRLERLAVKVLHAVHPFRHDTYRNACLTIAGYAAGMDLKEKKDTAYNFLAGAHEQAKPEVSKYVLDTTFEWGWEKGIGLPLTAPEHELEHVPTPYGALEGEIFSGIPEAANAGLYRRLMKDREWVWGDKVQNVGWIAKRGLHLLEGKEGTGKTRFVLDLWRRVYFRLPWPDGTEINLDQDSKILFVAADSHYDQIVLTSEAFGIPDESIIFTGTEADPYEYTSIDDPRTLNMIRLNCQRYNVQLVVIDTLMAASQRPIVDRQEVPKIANPLRQLARECNVAIILVGHLNKEGQTFGLAMGSQCDNVIRLEADEADEQTVKIKSVKARWNRFALPVLSVKHSETGMEADGENRIDDSNEKPGTRIRNGVLAYLEHYGESSQSDVVGRMIDEGFHRQSVYRIVNEMAKDGQILRYDLEKFGKNVPFLNTII